MSKISKLIVALGLCLPVVASAASPWAVKLGGSFVNPESNNGTVAGMTAHVSSEYNVTPSIEYFVQNTPFSVELLLAAPFKHQVVLDGAGEIADFKHLPPTITAKYNLPTFAGFTAYAGVGANATLVWDEKTKNGVTGKLKGDPSYGFAGQLGVNYLPQGSAWGAYVDARYVQIESDLTLDGAKVGTLEVNPMVYTVGLSYRF
jgi:outer membrane protein